MNITSDADRDYTLWDAPDDLKVTFRKHTRFGGTTVETEEINMTAQELRKILLETYIVWGLGVTCQ